MRTVSPHWLRPIAFFLSAISSIACISCVLERNDDTSGNSRNTRPDSSRFVPIVLAEGLNEPMAMDILPDNSVLFVERKGAVRLYDSESGRLSTIANLAIFSGIEDGLLGVALDPNYEKNPRVYMYYSVTNKSVNRLSRFDFVNKRLIVSSEKVLLEIPTQRKYCCHSAGAITFGPDGLLYLATGDNTDAEAAEGYVPIDERPGRELADDQATAANTNDLRGKILRIKPEADGSYSIPKGNLFVSETKGRPEIYIMGSRNPFRISVDMKTGFLYWGDVGPYTKVEGNEGSLSYDEINQAKAPGFYGWPYFLGDNEAFPDYDFATKQEGPKFDPARPLNTSPNNTGLQELPPAQPAMIWYGRLPSRRFPLVGKGGASAMAGPVYHSDLYPDSKVKLPRYYDGKLFIYEWVRRWIMAVTFDENGNYQSMEPFLSNVRMVAPMDLKIAPDGTLYMIEYGTNWFSKNGDAKLVRIEYSEGNRNPVPNIEADKLYGASPLEVRLSASGSQDHDTGQVLSYEWHIGNKKYTGTEVTHRFEDPGVYDVQLAVSDNEGGKGATTVHVHVGNAPPEVAIATTSNRTFYWDKSSFDYQIKVSDLEDAVIDTSAIKVSMSYVPYGKDMASSLAEGHEGLSALESNPLFVNLDCKTCHTLNSPSVGPAYEHIAKRYAGRSDARTLLTRKIIEGGSGNWGTRPMPGHPEMTLEQTGEIVKYILSLQNRNQHLPLNGTVSLDAHEGNGNAGGYVFVAQYRDRGANNIEPIVTRQSYYLRNPLVEIEDYDEGNLRIGTITTAFLSYAIVRPDSYVRFNSIDLTSVKRVDYRVQSNGVGGTIEIRLDSIDGPVAGSAVIEAGKVKDMKTGWKKASSKVKTTAGIHNVYFVFTNPRSEKQNLFNIDWIYFARD